MAEKRTQALRDLRRWLEAGKPVAEALACAGIPPDEHESCLAELEKEHAQDVSMLVQLAHSRTLFAVDILEELAKSAEDEKTRCTAAKSLLDLAVKAADMKIRAQQTSQKAKEQAIETKSLWDFT